MFGSEPKLSDWLKKWELKRKYRKSNKNSKETPVPEEDNTSHIFTLPPNLPFLSQLPPSMLPPPPGGYPKLPKVEWG